MEKDIVAEVTGNYFDFALVYWYCTDSRTKSMDFPGDIGRFIGLLTAKVMFFKIFSESVKLYGPGNSSLFV